MIMKNKKILKFVPPPDSPVFEEEIARSKEKSRLLKRRFLYFATASAMVFVLLIFMFSPFFHISNVNISGNSRVSDREILYRLNIGNNTHVFLFGTRAAARRISENSYIENVEIERHLPGFLQINITERRLTAYFEHSPGSFLFLDDNGRVLEVRTYFTEPLPVLEGLQISGFRLGEILDVPDTAAFSVIVQYAQLLNMHNLIDQVSHINVSDTSNIRIRVNNMEFNVGGGIADADEKIRWIAAVADELSDIPGFMNLSEIRNTRNEHFFEILQ